MIITTKPQKRTVFFCHENDESRDFQFHLFLPPFTFEFEDGQLSAYCLVNTSHQQNAFIWDLFWNTTRGKKGVIVVCLPEKLYSNHQDAIHDFWNSRFICNDDVIPGLKKWHLKTKEKTNLTWKMIYHYIYRFFPPSRNCLS